MGTRIPGLVAIYFAISYLASPAIALGTPAEILLIRHAEKQEKGNELSSMGWERARALPSLFEKHGGNSNFDPPEVLFGMAPDHKGGAIRSLETLKFVSKDLDLPIHGQFTGDDVDKLAAHLLHHESFDGKKVLVSWHHEGIPDLAKALGVSHVPDWDGDTFDRVWKITFDGPGGKAQLVDYPQHLLPGDSTGVIGGHSGGTGCASSFSHLR